MRLSILSAIALTAACGQSFCAEPKSNDCCCEDEMNIAATPSGAQKADREAKLNVYRQSVAGDKDAKKSWDDLKPELRTSLLSQLALEKEQSPAKTAAIAKLCSQSPADDPKGEAVAALATVAVAEKDGSIRALARNGLAAERDDRAPKLLVDGLTKGDDLVRGNAVEALKAFGGPKIYEVIIEHWLETWGAGARAHCVFARQQSYVADYNINGDSYDPEVRNFMEGVCLDVKSLKIERDVYYMTIRELAPDDPKIGAKPEAWQKWLNKESPKLAEEAEKKREAALAAVEAFAAKLENKK
jgi:hypothetical protein